MNYLYIDYASLYGVKPGENDFSGAIKRALHENVITFDEWKRLKSTIENTRPVCESELNSYKELLGHTTQDIDTLE